MDRELDDFKTRINLTEYAAARGYQLDRRESSRNSAVMRHPDGDKVIVARDLDGHWIYFSIRDEGDHGTIVDFVLNRTGETLGAVRKELRPWIGESPERPRAPIRTWVPEIEPSTKDLARVIAAFGRMRPVSRHPYLEGRGIPPATLADRRFERRIFTDARRNAVFPHYNRSGLSGFEIKNRGFTGFARGGEKGLWISGGPRGACRLVIAETAIDALSHAALFPDPLARYASTAGKMNPDQPDLIAAALEGLPEVRELVAATDNDPDGRKLAGQLEEIALESGRGFRAHAPEGEGADWNDALKARAQGLSGPIPEP